MDAVDSKMIFNSSRQARWFDPDVVDGFKMWRIWLLWGWNDIGRRFRRSVIGPLWHTLNLGFMVGSMGVVFTALWGMDMAHLMPYLCPGLIIWTFISGVISEGCAVFASSAGVIKAINLPLSVHVYRLLVRNLSLMFYNLFVYFAVVIYFKVPIGFEFILVIPAIALYLLNGTWVIMFLGLLCTRFRDMHQVVTNLLQLLFFVTPVFWFPQSLGKSQYLANYNPLFHFIDLARLPMMGKVPLAISWYVVIAITVIGWAITMPFYARNRRRTANWL